MKAAILLALASGVAFGQTAAPQFEAASINELQPPFRALFTMKVSGTLISMEGYTLPTMVAAAYGVATYRLDAKTIPDNARGTYYRIEARAPGDAAPDKATVQAMLQHLLAERFHLKVHKEMRDFPVYALVVSKNGPKLKPGSGETDCRRVTGPEHPADRNYRHSLQNCPASLLAPMIDADRPVLDKTGLTGIYDILIVYTPEFRMRNSEEVTDIRIRDAIRQLGLQLDPQMEPMEVVVIDRMDTTPSAN